MKILLAIDAFPPVVDGAVTGLLNLTKCYKQRGHEVHFVVPYHPETPAQNGSVLFETYSLPFPTYDPYRLALPIAFPVRTQAKNFDFDLVHVNSPFGVGIVARNLAAERKIPCLFTFHTLFAEASMQYTSWLERFLSRPIRTYLRHFSNAADHVVTPSEAVKEVLLKYGVTKPIDVIPTGIDPQTVTTNFKTDIRKKYGIPPEVPILLFVGRLASEKNPSWLFSALADASRKGLGFHCLIVGKGPARSGFEDLVKKEKLQNKVTFTGYLSQEEMIQCYANSDLFCMPSLIECLCLAAIEAMMNGLPVLAVRAMGLQQIVQNGLNGLLTDPNPNAFSEGLSRLLVDHEKRKEMGQEALRLSRQMTGEICADRYITLYEKLIKDQKGLAKRPLKTVPLVAKSLLGI